MFMNFVFGAFEIKFYFFSWFGKMISLINAVY